jgi:hypothetical protein
MDQIEELSVPNVKNLIDLVLAVNSQSVLLNLNLIGYLNARLSSETPMNFSKLVSESQYFMRFVLTDYRYLMTRSEVADFFKCFMTRFIRSVANKSQKAENFSNLLSQIVKNIISLSLSTINGIRFYYEFSRAKLEAFVESLDNDITPNFNSHLELKQANILGSIKTILMIVSAISEC